jgi:hypothetical protein
MIRAADLAAQFHPVDDLGQGLVRCGDELPKKTIHTYFLLDAGPGHCPFAVSDSRTDDAFARQLLQTCGDRAVTELTRIGLGHNAYGFTHLLCVPHTHHAELKGRLDAQRPRTTLCIPVFASEFSGKETAEQFATLRRDIVPSLQWDRSASPKISLRFDNPKTRGGTGEGYVFARFDMVVREIDNLRGVTDGFVEIVNHAGNSVEIVFSSAAEYCWIPDREDAQAQTLPRDALMDRLRPFLTP